ncbi:MAG: BTAD domain-containing putative transcriptional regulator [Gemmatimonadota bacterium]|nr:BTAD domain-containing putative transcriptional regulator [Gemmatimonadota bacterium]
MPAIPPEEGAAGRLVTLGRVGYDGPHAEGAARLLGQPKRLAVLAYILVAQREGIVSRDRVVGMFWPESDEVRARNALRQTVSFIRAALGRDVVESVGLHALRISSALACDAVHFEWLLDEGRREEALGAYGGEFLPGLHVPGSVGFTSWVEARRAQFGHRAAKAAWDLSAAREAAGDAGGAAFWGKRALALSPFSESEVQRLLRLLTRLGDFGGALRAYRGLKDALEEELGVVPSPETLQLVSDAMTRAAARGERLTALDAPRRFNVDRRVAERRQSQREWRGAERRRGDRRVGERRSGTDRRAR